MRCLTVQCEGATTLFLVIFKRNLIRSVDRYAFTVGTIVFLYRLTRSRSMICLYGWLRKQTVVSTVCLKLFDPKAINYSCINSPFYIHRM
jgi:hypothetical protein